MNAKEAMEATCRTSRVLLWICGVGAFMLWLLADPLIVWIYGSQYQPSILPMRILLPGVFIFCLHQVYFRFFQSQGNPGVPTIVLAVALVVNILLNLWWIPLWQVGGAALSSVVSYILCMGCILFLFRRRTQKPWRDLVVVKYSDLRTVFGSLFRERSQREFMGHQS